MCRTAAWVLVISLIVGVTAFLLATLAQVPDVFPCTHPTFQVLVPADATTLAFDLVVLPQATSSIRLWLLAIGVTVGIAALWLGSYEESPSGSEATAFQSSVHSASLNPAASTFL